MFRFFKNRCYIRSLRTRIQECEGEIVQCAINLAALPDDDSGCDCEGCEAYSKADETAKIIERLKELVGDLESCDRALQAETA